MLFMTPSYGSRICVNYVDPEISAFQNRLSFGFSVLGMSVIYIIMDVRAILMFLERIIGLDYMLERLAEKGRRLASLGIENSSVAYFF
jgi:hypothetical protein